MTPKAAKAYVKHAYPKARAVKGVITEQYFIVSAQLAADDVSRFETEDEAWVWEATQMQEQLWREALESL